MSEVSFGQYGKSFQEKTVQALIVDHEWAARMSEVVNTDFFDLKYLKFLADRLFAYYTKYKCFPAFPMLVVMVKDELRAESDTILKTQVIDFLQRTRVAADTSDFEYVKDKSLDFCKKQSLRIALEESVDLINKEQFERVPDLIKKALMAGETPSIGLEFFDDMETRFKRTNRLPVPTGIPLLDDKQILNGGVGKGELAVIVAATGVGKCEIGSTCIDIKYTGVKINGIQYKPWSYLNTKRGRIRVRDIVETDELTIKYQQRDETLTIADLFDQIGLDTFSSDLDDDSISSETFGIEVRSLDTYYPVEALRIIKPHQTWRIVTSSGKMLISAHEHIVYMPRVEGWQFVNKCDTNDYVMTADGPERIVECGPNSDLPELLYDMQVAIAHSYYTNGILSHNSHFLVQMGCAALRAGKNVLHYTMELNESVVGIRYDSNLCRIPSLDVYDRQDDVKKFYNENEMGRLIIKEYPTKTPTVNTIRAHVEKAILKGIRPGLIIIDYADVIRSSKQYDSLRHELQFVYEEIRNLAGELQIPVWTASQSNREGSDSEIVDLANMSEAYGKAMTADIVISLSRRPMEKSKGIGRLFVAKNRAGRDGLVYPCKIDTAMSLIEILEDADSETLEQTKSNDTKTMKNELREKWDKLRRSEP